MGLAILDARPFLLSLFSVALAGAVPVPLFPPVGAGPLALQSWTTHTERALRASGAAALILDARSRKAVPDLQP